MNKLTVVGIVSAATMLLPVMASAATISNPLFSNGQTSIDATGGSTVSGTFTLTVGAGEVVEFLRTQSDPSQPFVDKSVGEQLGYQEQVYTGVPFSVKVPPNTGTYFPTVQGAGIWGGGRSINGADNVTLGSSGLGTVRVVTNATTGGSTGGGSMSGTVDWTYNGKTYQVPADMVFLLDLLLGAAIPQKPAYCSGMIAFNGMNATAVQSWLLSTPHAHIFHAAGVYAATGYYGPVSQSAMAAAQFACK